MSVFINIKKGFYLMAIAICILAVEGCNKKKITSVTPNPAATDPHSFVVYSQIRYNSTPTNLSQYGISYSMLHPPTNFLNVAPKDTSLTGNANLDNNVIDSLKLATLALNDLALSANVPIILDIESWSFEAAQLPATINNFTKVIEIYKASNARSPIGFYGSFPQTKYQWTNIDNPTAYQNWQTVNNNLIPVVKLIQFFALSLYTRDNIIDSANWRLFAQANFNEAKRYNVKAPIYAYIQPQYAKTAVFLPANYWQYQLDQLYNIGYDGAIIWTSNKDSSGTVIDFNTAIQQDWWTTTINFIKEKDIKVQ
jgi:hypothetical protein